MTTPRQRTGTAPEGPPFAQAAKSAWTEDDIGNRKSATEGGAATAYTANALNQYASFTHDPDGNRLTGARPGQTNAWNGENELIDVVENGTSVAQYEYDHLGRRVRKKSAAEDTLFLYDDWNVVAEYEVIAGRGEPTKTYTWGLDLSGSMQDAGGVGGLLAVQDGAEPYGVVYDGNGNVSELVDAQGKVAAHYEYDAFGNVLVKSGDYAEENRYRFSTKPVDVETGLWYYGYRYYDSGNGRWLKRDPIAEDGGVNLYGFIENSGINNFDLLGTLTKAQFKAEANRLISSGVHDPDKIFQGLVLHYFRNDQPFLSWLPVWNCTKDMQHIFSALGDVLATNFKGQPFGSSLETQEAKTFRKVRYWVENVEYWKNPQKNNCWELRKKTSPNSVVTNTTFKFGRRMDAIMHFFGAAAVSVNIGEWPTDLIVGPLVEIGDMIKAAIRGEQLIGDQGWSSHDIEWNKRGSELQNSF